MSDLHITFGSQLFATQHLKKAQIKSVFMCETPELCTYYKFHKHKIIFFLSAMRHYAEELKSEDIKVHYNKLSDTEKIVSYEDVLASFIKTNKVTSLSVFEIEDKFMETRIQKFCEKSKLKLTVLKSPNFFVGRTDFKKYLEKNKKPFMKTFYEKVRQGSGILMSAKGEPIGGHYSFDDENRKPWKAKMTTPAVESPQRSKTDLAVIKLVSERFSDHYGDCENFWLPTNRKDSILWMNQFFADRFKDFGPYEDAITGNEKFLFHSVLSPMMNVGLINPQDVVAAALKSAEKQKIPVNSVEGFVRQIIGWREFIRGIYQNFSDFQEKQNFFKHTRDMKTTWYTARTGVPPLDDAIKKVIDIGYNHHIERLMILSNIMNLSELNPNRVHQWFMEMYVDSSDWVMGPNVYGMGLFSDGGVFATKPYIAGSNYILKMSDYKKADWCDEIDGLYWRFIENHKAFFSKNYRLSMMVKLADKMKADRKEKIYKAADEFLKRNTTKS